MECTFFRSFCGNSKLNFRVKCANSRRHSRERGNPFLPTNPRIHFVFHKKMRGDSKLNFRVKFAENSKINRPEWIPAFAGMTGFFRGNDGVFSAKSRRVHRNGMYFFRSFCGNGNLIFRRYFPPILRQMSGARRVLISHKFYKFLRWGGFFDKITLFRLGGFSRRS